MPDKIIKNRAETRGRKTISPDGVKKSIPFRLSPTLISKLESASQRRGDKINLVENALNQYFDGYNDYLKKLLVIIRASTDYEDMTLMLNDALKGKAISKSTAHRWRLSSDNPDYLVMSADEFRQVLDLIIELFENVSDDKKSAH